MSFISLLCIGHVFCSHIQVLGIFKCHVLHIIAIYQSVGHVLCCHVQVLGIWYFQWPCGSYYCLISVGLVFCCHIQVLGIRYFPRQCASYHCRILVGLFFCYHTQVLGIRYFQSHFLHIIVVYWWVLPFALIYKY